MENTSVTEDCYMKGLIFDSVSTPDKVTEKKKSAPFYTPTQGSLGFLWLTRVLIVSGESHSTGDCPLSLKSTSSYPLTGCEKRARAPANACSDVCVFVSACALC